MSERWVFVFYRAPTEPSSARVTAWRRLHRLGALYVGPSACLIPARLEAESKVAQVAADLRQAGGELDQYVVEGFAAAAEADIEARYNQARDAEYAELIERAAGVIGELEREGARGKFTFAEVEENEADIAKLRRWLRRIQSRDVFGAGSREAAQAAIEAAQSKLNTFVKIASAREDQSVLLLADDKLEPEPAPSPLRSASKRREPR
jgi:hypothetical protein